MFFDKTNLKIQLQKERNNSQNQDIMLEQVYHILKNHQSNEDRIKSNISNSNNAVITNFDFDLLKTDAIYHIDQIKRICIDYRLRFLDSTYFKGEIPEEAFSKIAALEKEHNTEIKNFKIIAPSKLFKLVDKDDPLLFAPIGNEYFYLIHKWGNDLGAFRKLFMWPFKNVINLLVVLVVLSFLVIQLIPHGLFSKNNSGVESLVLFFFMFKSIVAVVIYYAFAMGKNFNPAIWNKKYFNA